MSRSEGATAHVVPLLEAYAAGALAPEEAERVARHLRECAECQDQMEQLALYQIIRAAPAPTVGPELRQRVYARIAAASEPAARDSARTALATRRQRRPWFSQAHRHFGARATSGWLGGAVAVVLVALLVSVFWALPRLRQPSGNGGRLIGQMPTETAPASVGASTAACPASATKVSLPPHAFLTHVVMASPAEGWAIGDIMDDNFNTTQGLIIHFSKCHWTPIAMDLSGIGLDNISMDSPTDGWITATQTDGAPFLLHLSNGVWSWVMTPPALQQNPSSLASVAPFGPQDVWLTASTSKTATGQMSPMLLMRLHNDVWSAVTSPLPIIYGLAPVGPNDLWLSGQISTTSAQPSDFRFAHYHDGAWDVMPQPAETALTAMHAVSSTDIWASGTIPKTSPTHQQTSLPVVAHFDGTAWNVAPEAAPPGAESGALAVAFGDGDGWAYQSSETRPSTNSSPHQYISGLWLETNGQWRALNWPYKNLDYIQSFAPVSSGEVWAIGGYMVEVLDPVQNSSPGTSYMGYEQTVLLHYADGAWTRYG